MFVPKAYPGEPINSQNSDDCKYCWKEPKPKIAFTENIMPNTQEPIGQNRLFELRLPEQVWYIPRVMLNHFLGCLGIKYLIRISKVHYVVPIKKQ